mgnify:CR=1 FL=1
MTMLDRGTLPSARRDFGAALGTVQRLQDMGIPMPRVENIGHFIVSIARCERIREPRQERAAPEPAREGA